MCPDLGKQSTDFRGAVCSTLNATQIRGVVAVVWPNRISSEHKKRRGYSDADKMHFLRSVYEEAGSFSYFSDLFHGCDERK